MKKKATDKNNKLSTFAYPWKNIENSRNKWASLVIIDNINKIFTRHIVKDKTELELRL